ncbi:CvpA family protein [Stenotrophomonas sp. 24(2023)]|uniref:CvpA family protein n=1 Tax=Stenotrophomonas sp. 24(2023) TaxID=3068324 RepID=UPI0027E0AB48|nr:CvpA family protein [Stenotrophomonas sp. 24(2023)]WMJ68011.1 CvpA family protein [Stenotrophomonas sp. 24(2023)]
MIDLVLGVLIGTSVLFGFFRGFIGTVVGLLAWLVAGWAALTFGEPAARAWAAPELPGSGHYLAGYLGVFVLVLVAVSLLGLLLKALAKLALLGGVDRLLGGALGLVRGVFIACVLLVLGGYTALPGEPAWQQSQLRPLLQPAVGWMQAQLPHLEGVLPQAVPLDGLLPQALPLPLDENAPSAMQELGKPAATGDNGVLSTVVAGGRWLRSAAQEPGAASPLPSNIEPAPERPAQPAPERSGTPGQARPSSL